MNTLNKRLNDKKETITKTIVDCPSTNITAYSSHLKNSLENQKIELVVEHKADFNHLIVGAASIMAKVTREKELEQIKKKYVVDFGSGYPSDPKTVNFLKKNFDKPRFSELFRKSWQTYKNVAGKKPQSSLGDF